MNFPTAPFVTAALLLWFRDLPQTLWKRGARSGDSPADRIPGVYADPDVPRALVGPVRRIEAALGRAVRSMGPSAPPLATQLEWCAEHHSRRGEAGLALALLHRAIRHHAAAPSLPLEDTPAFQQLARQARTLHDGPALAALRTRAWAIHEAAHGPTPAHARHEWAAVLDRREGDEIHAIAELERALELRAGLLHPDLDGTAQLHEGLAELIAKHGPLDRAVELWRSALAMREQAHGTTHLRAWRAVTGLAEGLAQRGETGEAETLFQRAIAMHEAAPEPDLRGTAASVNNLALHYHARGDLARAGALYERALAIVRRALPETHPDVTVAVENLLRLYRDRGDFTRGEPN